MTLIFSVCAVFQPVAVRNWKVAKSSSEIKTDTHPLSPQNKLVKGAKCAWRFTQKFFLFLQGEVTTGTAAASDFQQTVAWISSQQSNSSPGTWNHTGSMSAPRLIYHPTLSAAEITPPAHQLPGYAAIQHVVALNSKLLVFSQKKRAISAPNWPARTVHVPTFQSKLFFFADYRSATKIQPASDYCCQGLQCSLLGTHLAALFPFSGKSRSATIEKTKLLFFRMMIHRWKENGTVRTTIQRGLQWCD